MIIFLHIKFLPLANLSKALRTQQTNFCQLLFDFSRTYDSTSQYRMYEILALQNVPAKYIRLLKTFIHGAKGRVPSEEFSVANGLKQRKTLSPSLFDRVLEYVARHFQEEVVSLDQKRGKYRF